MQRYRRIFRERIPVASIVATGLLAVAISAGAAPEDPGESAGGPSLAGRHRIELRAGYWESEQLAHTSPVFYVERTTRVENVLGVLSYAYWSHDQVATDITLRGQVAGATSFKNRIGTTDSTVVVTSLLFGVRLYPVPSRVTPFRPYLTAAIGPYLGIEARSEFDGRKVEHITTAGAFGGYLGGGLDFQFGRYVMAGVNVGYNLVADFPEALGLKRNFSGVEMSAGISLLLGR